MQCYQKQHIDETFQRRALYIASAVDNDIERHIDITLHTPESKKRDNTEAFIAKVFLNHHGAQLNYFLPNLFSISDFNSQTFAAVGFKLLDEDPVFLERYLNKPIEKILQPHITQKVRRSDIAEVGNLACHQSGASRALIASISFYLHDQGIEWAVFTGTRMVSAILQRMGIPVLSLAKAEAACLGHERSDWGSYYNHNPYVMAVNIAAAKTVSKRQFNYHGLNQ